MYTLGIETSCDETAAAILKDERDIRASLVLSQIDLHKYFGGVIPELASRKHIEVLPHLVKDTLKEAKLALKDISLITVTNGPGLVGALLVGLSYGKALSYSLKVPFIGVNHVEAHLYANLMEYPELQFPCIGLIVSGGHTILCEITDIGKYKILGQTLDDACGEAFDKAAKLLGLGYPGGPVIDSLSRNGDPDALQFPRAMAEKKNYDFSFSGLKTSLVYYVKGYKQFRKKAVRKNGITTSDIVASFQEAITDQLITKTIGACQETGHNKIILGGGVARNTRLREKLKEETKKRNWQLFIPSPHLCVDNAVMVAGLGYARYKKYGPSEFSLDADPRLSL